MKKANWFKNAKRTHVTCGPVSCIGTNYRLSVSYWLTCLRLLSPSVGEATPTITASTLAL